MGQFSGCTEATFHASTKISSTGEPRASAASQKRSGIGGDPYRRRPSNIGIAGGGDAITSNASRERETRSRTRSSSDAPQPARAETCVASERFLGFRDCPVDHSREVSREDVLARSALTAEASRDSLEALWMKAANEIDAHLAWCVGRGRDLEEPDLASLVSAVAARDSGALREGLLHLTGGNVDALRVEVDRLCEAEERHIVLRELEAAILRADVDDIELWAEEATRLGVDVAFEKRYCDTLRAALMEFAKYSDTIPFANAPADLHEEDAVFRTASSWSDDTSKFMTQESAYVTPDETNGLDGDGDGAFEELWVELETAIALNDVSRALEAVSLLESAGELDAESAAEVRAEVQGGVESESAPSRDYGFDRRATYDSSRTTSARGHSSADSGTGARRIPQHAPSRPSNATPSPQQAAPKFPARGASNPSYHGRGSAGSAEARVEADESPSPRGVPEHMYSAPKAQYKYAAPPRESAPRSASKRSEQQMPNGRSMFRETFWKRRVNLQTARRLHAARFAASNQAHPQAQAEGFPDPRMRAPSAPPPPRCAPAPPRRAESTYAGQARNEQPRSQPGASSPRGAGHYRQASKTTSAANQAGTQSQKPSSVPYPKAGRIGSEAPERDPGFYPRTHVPPPAAGGASSRRAYSEGPQRERPDAGPRQQRASATAAPPQPPPAAKAAPKARSSSGAQQSSSTAGAGGGRGARDGSGEGRPGPGPPPRPPPPPPRAGPQSDAGASRGGGGEGGRREERRSPAQAAGSSTEAAALELLGLQAGFSPEELRSAYKKAAMKWHPDRPAWRTAGEEEVKRATETFQRVKDAYDYLSGKPCRPS
eukprot:TRINITY_DN17945_c0_g1_i1.p1 TRINITY_DN17945_c0_g1~~TRINITY_DN17945_c0_g1_i1.p1  ORF type:complete len:832 (-),score=115.70 TRINITY_DN17945_c0_g1_i1:438-2933(-)